MKPLVLVHGAWYGAWCWRPVVQLLRRSWPELPVYTPTLTGLGERKHLLTKDTGLETHIQDLLSVYEAEELSDTILTAHSYAGMPAVGAVDRLPAGAVHTLVLLDAYLPENGKSAWDIRTADPRGSVVPVKLDPVTNQMPAPDPAHHGLSGAVLDWARRRLTPQPTRGFTEKIHLSPQWQDKVHRRVFIRNQQFAAYYFDRHFSELQNNPSWTVRAEAVPHHHFMMEPDWLLRLLQSLDVNSLSLLLLVAASLAAEQQCPDQRSVCPNEDTCCPAASGGYGCCPGGSAVCCPGGTHCCPSGYSCNTDLTCTANNPNTHRYDTWTLQWRLCYGPLPLQRMPNVLGSQAFPYFSSNGAIGAPVYSRVKAAVVVCHGAARDADEYYCAMMEAVRLQQRFQPGEVMVVAPYFMQAPDDIPPNTVQWNGSDPNGPWRSGQQSLPNENNQTISSFAILDMFLTYLNNSRLYPDLQLVVMAGHSSGGQTVQRYALTQRAMRLGADGSRIFRYVVGNPSSFAYLDARRWINGTLQAVPAAQQTSCPEYNDWEWGLAGNWPPYFQGMSLQSAVATYARKNVIYLQGQNDTCNRDLEPGCQSHGLETTCMDMLEGRFRLERGLQYFQFLENFYQQQVQNLSIVPNVSHDHSLLFQSSEGLEAIFGPFEQLKPGRWSSFTSTDIIMTVVSLTAAVLVLGLVINRCARNGVRDCYHNRDSKLLYERLKSNV